MDDVILPVLAFGLVAIVVLVPIAALIMAVSHRRQIALMKMSIEDLQTRLARSEWWIGELARRGEAHVPSPAAAPAAAPTIPAPPTSTSTSTPTSTPTPTLPPTYSPSVTFPPSAPPPPMATVPAPPPRLDILFPSPSPVAAAPAPSFDWEKLVGVRLFAWLGGIGLFIGAAFFLEYSIEHALIAPPLRVGIGLVSGALALALGDYLRTKADRAGQALGGAGIATLYASLFAARSLYQLIPASAAFAGMGFVTLLAGLIAVRRDAFVLAVIGLLGGFATPWLLSTGEDHRYALFAYVALLDVGVLVVGTRRRWDALSAMALVCTAAIFAGWSAEYLDAGGVLFALAVAALLGALFIASAWRAEARRESTPVNRAIAAAALTAPFLTAVVAATEPELRAGVPLLAGYLALLLAGVLAVVARWNTPFALEVAAGFSVVTLSAGLTEAAWSNEQVATLLVASAVPFLLFAFYLLGRARGASFVAPARNAAGIALGGSWIFATHALSLDANARPIAPVAIYVAAHVVGLVAIGLLESSAAWLAAAQGVWLVTLLGFTPRYEASRLVEFVPFIVAPMLAFFALPLATGRARAQSLGWVAGACALVTHYAILYGLARNVWPDAALGAGAIVLGALALGMLSRARASVAPERSRTVVATLGGVTLLFVSAAVPIALSHQWITLAWALEATALAWLYLRVPHKGLLASSALLSVFTLIRLIANPWLWEYHPRSGVIVVNWYLYTFGLPALAMFGAAFLLRNDATAQRYRYSLGHWFAGGLLAFVLLNVEIADAYSTGQTIGIHLGASLGEDMTYSLGWGVFGIITLLLGMRFQSAKARMSALAVLILTIGKVFLHDLWHLGALYRVGSMVGLAAALLAVSFLTQRFILRGDRQ